MQISNMNVPTHFPSTSRPLFREVAFQWAQALRVDAADDDVGLAKARNRVSRRKRKAVLSPEQFIAASLSLVLSKHLTAR